MTEMASILLLLAFMNLAMAYTSVVTKINFPDEGHRRNDVSGIMLFKGNNDEESINKLLNIHAKVARQVLTMILKNGGSFFMTSNPKMDIDLPQIEPEICANKKQHQKQSSGVFFLTKLLDSASQSFNNSEAGVTPFVAGQYNKCISLPSSESDVKDENCNGENKLNESSSVGSKQEAEKKLMHEIENYSNTFPTQNDIQKVRSTRQSVYQNTSVSTPNSFPKNTFRDVISKSENDRKPREKSNNYPQNAKNNTLSNTLQFSNKHGGEAEYHYNISETEKSMYVNTSANGNQSTNSEIYPKLAISTEEVDRKRGSNFSNQPLSPVIHSPNAEEPVKNESQLVTKQNNQEKMSIQPDIPLSFTNNVTEDGNPNCRNLTQDINPTNASSISNKTHDYNLLSDVTSVKVNPITLICENNSSIALNNESNNVKYTGKNFVPSDKLVNTLTKSEAVTHYVETRSYKESPSFDETSFKVELDSDPVLDIATQGNHHSATPGFSIKFHQLGDNPDLENKSFSSLERTRRDKKSRPTKNAIYRVRFEATIEQQGSRKSSRKSKNGKHKKGKSKRKSEKKKSSSTSRSSKDKKRKCKKRKSDSRRPRQ